MELNVDVDVDVGQSHTDYDQSCELKIDFTRAPITAGGE